MHHEAAKQNEIDKVICISGLVEVLIRIEVDNRAICQQLLDHSNVELAENGVLLMKHYVRNVDAAGAFVSELLLQLEEAILDVVLNALR